jgi:glycine/D-amino acid oxidase-like deaminating enzyme
MQQASIWEKESFFAHQDVIIIGSGFTGLWSAFYLKKYHPKLKILIVDRGIVPYGASSRNAGFACFGSITELLNDARKMGEEKMLHLVEMRYEGLKRIRKTFNKKDIEFEKLGGYELITPVQYEKEKQLKNDIGWMNILLRKSLKEEKVFKIADKKIASFGFANVSHLVENRLEAQLHSGKLLQMLLQRVQSMGVSVLSNIEVKSYEKSNGKVFLHSNLPVTLTSDQLLICTNAFAKELLPELNVDPVRGQVLVTSPIKKLSFSGTFHYDEGYYYFRNIGDRILLGGARNSDFAAEATNDFSTTEPIQEILQNFLKENIIPGKKFSIDYRWSGIMGMGKDKMPIVKKVKPNIFCAVRLSGMGVALAPVVGENMAKMMME